MKRETIHISPEPALVKVSVIQPALKRFDRQHNIDLILEMTQREAEREKPHFICLPNYFFQQGTDTLEGPSTEGLIQLAQRHDTYIIGGMARKHAESPKASNTGFLIDPDGKIHPLQQKLHMIPLEKKKLQAGSGFAVFKTPMAIIGIVLCNDVFYPEAARCLALMGAEIIFIPSLIGGLGVTGLQITARARALENQVFVVSANGIPHEAAEIHNDLPMGMSGIYSPFLDQIDLAVAGARQQTICAVLDLDQLRELKQVHGPAAENHSQLATGRGFNMLVDRRPEIYAPILLAHDQDLS